MKVYIIIGYSGISIEILDVFDSYKKAKDCVECEYPNVLTNIIEMEVS